MCFIWKTVLVSFLETIGDPKTTFEKEQTRLSSLAIQLWFRLQKNFLVHSEVASEQKSKNRRTQYYKIYVEHYHVNISSEDFWNLILSFIQTTNATSTDGIKREQGNKRKNCIDVLDQRQT